MASRLLPTHEERLLAQIQEHGLASFAVGIVEEAYSAFMLRGGEKGVRAAPGTSRFGGPPDVSRELANATELDELIFVFQVDLADLPGGDGLGLPSAGLLSVFSNSNADEGRTFYFPPGTELVRRDMPEPDPDYVFHSIVPHDLVVELSVDLASYGHDLVFAVEDAGLDDAYTELEDAVSAPEGEYFGRILGRFSELNGDMREDAAENVGGSPGEWRSLWQILSSFQSGLVISDMHSMHGLIREEHLLSRVFDNVYSQTTND